MIPCGARNCGRRGPPPPPGGAAAGRPAARARRRRDLARLVVDEVEVQDVVVVHGHGLSPPGRWRYGVHAERPPAAECTGDSAAEDVPLVRRRTDTGVVRCLRTSRPSARPRPLPPAQAARSRRLRLGLARARRADRARGRAQDRPARGEARGARRARDGGRLPAAPRALRPGLRLRRRRAATSTSRTSTSAAARCARCSAPEDVDDATAVEIAAQVLDGLAHAHRRGIVHRDVKPSNVLVEDEPRDLRARARLRARAVRRGRHADRGRRRPRHARVHRARAALGGEEASERSDVWAVGVILWEALAGSHPFWGVPLPQVASTIASGRAAALGAPRRPPAAPARRDRRRALGRSGQAPAGRAARGGAARGVRRPARAGRAPSARRPVPPARRRRRQPRRRRPRRSRSGSASPRPGSPSLATAGRRLAPARSGRAARSPRSRSPRASSTLRAPRLGLALALAAPLFPLGNVAQAAAVVYGVLALAWLAVTWRDPRAGLAFWAGPLLAPLGLLALLPLAVQPARGCVAPRAPRGRRRPRRRRRRRARRGARCR